VEGLVLQGLHYLSEHPETIAATIRAYDEYQRSLKETSDEEAQQRRLHDELARLETELAGVKRAMLAAIRAGLSEDDFAADLASIAARRAAAEASLRELEPVPAASMQHREAPHTTAEKVARVAQAIITVFTAADAECSPSVKQSLLVPLIESVTPTEWCGERHSHDSEEGIEMRLRDQTLQFIKMKAFLSVN
jgi:hypothetical protein